MSRVLGEPYVSICVCRLAPASASISGHSSCLFASSTAASHSERRDLLVRFVIFTRVSPPHSKKDYDFSLWYIQGRKPRSSGILQ